MSDESLKLVDCVFKGCMINVSFIRAGQWLVCDAYFTELSRVILKIDQNNLNQVDCIGCGHLACSQYILVYSWQRSLAYSYYNFVIFVYMHGDMFTLL